MRNTVRIVVADDHAVVRAGIANALRGLENINIVGEASDGNSLLALLAKTRPDLLVTDVTMPNFEPIEAIRELRACYPDMLILIVSAYDDDMYVQGLLRAGVNGYHLKDQPLSDLRLAVQRVLAGERWVCSPLLEKLVNGQSASDGTLTTRQRDILKLLKEGLDNYAIARRTGLSVKTIENHLTRLYRQINVQSRLEAVNYCLQHPNILGDSRTPASPEYKLGMDDLGSVTNSGNMRVHDSAHPAILIVDDNTRYRAQMRRMVGKNCPQAIIYEAENIAGSLQTVEAVHPELVFADVVLGDENGINCAYQIKSMAPMTRVVLISAYPDREFRRAGLAAGAVAFLDKKDLNNATMREVIADLVG